MYIVSKKDLGVRLKQIRIYLSLSQQELRDKLEINQATISRMEDGSGISWENFIKILSFYSQYIYIDSLFQENFQIISIDGQGEQEIFKSNITSITRKMIMDALANYQSKTSAEYSELQDNITKALNLLSE
jgi:DNA-binding XRE family transcriptional regulator